MSKPDPVVETEEEVEAPVAIDSDVAKHISEISSKDLTYFNTKNGTFYTKAKEILQTDDFEAAMTIVATGLTTLESMLQGQDNHESLAPLYYLYGTTLLYSIEESQDSAEASVMAQGAEQSAEDLEIAWENLESARNIISTMSCEGSEEEERILDLAQIHLRLADLSRINGHYEQAISDYESCCDSRRSVLTGDKVWDRKIADVEYQLGMTSVELAAQAEKNLMNKEGGDGKTNPAIAAMAAASGMELPDESQKVDLSASEINALREKAIRHYVQCARIFAGIIALKSGEDPDKISEADESLENNENKKMAASEAKAASSSNVQEIASKALKNIRDRVSNVKASSEDDKLDIEDFSDILDVIQETIDACETDREGLRDVVEMRKKVEEEINKDDANPFGQSSADEGTTTIGFGTSDSKPTAAASSATTIGFGGATSNIGFGSSSEAAKTVTPMMVVKKKKKAPTLEKVEAKKARAE